MGHGFWGDFPSVWSDLEKIRGLLLDELKKGHPEVRQALTDLAGSNGKMLRAGYFVLCSGFGEMDPIKRDRFGAAIEMLHMATLIHDDVIDDSTTRRGLPTIHTQHGKRNAVLMGDYLLTLCFTLVAEYARPGNIALLSRTLNSICMSELHQSAQLFHQSTSVRQYLRKIAGKTAALFSLSCFLGGFEGTCPEALARQMARLGYDIGIAFQIIDDILDFQGDTDLLGKPVYKDLAEGIYTLPLILALQKDDGPLSFLLGQIPYSESSILKIVELVHSRGIKDARNLAGKYTQRALKTIDKLPNGETKILLAEVTKKLLYRNY
jgi:heptaprenyl diphosphate synthase